MEPSESMVICLPSAALVKLPFSLCDLAAAVEKILVNRMKSLGACVALTATDDCICENTSSNSAIEWCSGAFDISMERSSDIWHSS